MKSLRALKSRPFIFWEGTYRENAASDEDWSD